MDEKDLDRWRGRVDAYMEQSVADRSGLHGIIERVIERADRRHEELLEELRKASHAQRDALQTLTNALAVQKARIDRWEARAEGASWAARVVPHAISAMLGAIAGWVAAIKSAGPPP